MVQIVGPLLLAVVFVVSGVSKGFDPQPTEKVIGVLFGGSLPGWSVTGLVVVEILLAAWLVSGLRLHAALFVTITLLGVFSVLIAALFFISPTSPCGCGMPSLSGHAVVDNGIAIARNALLIAIAVLSWPACNSFT